MISEEDDCCRASSLSKRNTMSSFDLLAELDRRIKARYLQLGGYLHDADECRLAAKRFLEQGHAISAAGQVRSSLEFCETHRVEEIKYRNLVALRKLLVDAKRNLSMAELLQKCSEEVRATLNRMPDVMELQERWSDATDRVREDQTALLSSITMDEVPDSEDIELPSSVTDEQVANALEKLRAPPSPPLPEVAAPTASKTREKCNALL
jgi:hypothetical protein